ncbi:MAG: sulfite exporter TauE/SafE family protein [Xanthobacteraceae bacterium]|nr:sulfite exporter TauE/SafE family protein [Xanthobacteraceae bacterium]MCW5676394.1 sulfite exporter TauE/SafE family protein [Xanthobacteraceae bacterium]
MPFDTVLVGSLVTAFVAGVLRGATGFGSALVMAPFLSVLLGPSVGVPLTIIMGFVGSLFLLPYYRKQIELGVVGELSIFGLIFVFPGVWLLNFLDANMMRRIIAVAVFVIAGSMLLSRKVSFRSESKIIDRIYIAIASAIGGVAMGATGMGGPPIVTYLAGRGGSPEQQKANILFAVGALEVATIAIMIFGGYFTQKALVLTGWLILPFCIGLWIGEWWFRSMLSNVYHRLVMITLMITGIVVAFL